MQEDIQINGSSISGKLKKVNEYPEFGDAEANSPSHYLALSFESSNADKITTKVIGGSGIETDCTADKFCVYRIKDTSQQIEVKATQSDKTTTKTYNLNGLILES